MRLTVTVVSPATGRQADVAIETDPGTTLAQVAAELDRLMHGMLAAVPEPWVPDLFVGGHRLPGDMPLAGSPLLDGCVVSLGDPAGCPPPEPPGAVELRIAGGPAAGGVYRLEPGMTDIGGPAPGEARPEEQPDISIADPAVPALAVRVIIGPGGWQLAPFGGAEVLLDGQPLDGGAYWRPGQQVAVGDTLLDLVPYEPPDAALRARRGCLTAPQTLPESDLIGVRLPRDHVGRPPRPGRALLSTGDGTLATIAVPFG